MKRVFQIRSYEPADYSTIAPWWEARGAEAWPESLIPPHGIVVEMDGRPVASGWLFLVEGMHVAFFHGMVTRPMLGVSLARQALQHLFEGLDIIMRNSGRTIILGTVEPGAMIHHAKKLGWGVLGRPVQSVVKVVKPS